MRCVLRSFRQAVFPAVLASSVACDGGTDVFHLVGVSVALSSDSLIAPGSVAIRVTATNLSWQDVLVVPSHCPEAFVVLDRDGRTVGPAPKLCALVGIPPIALAPNESYEFHHDWDGQGLDGPLPSGEYFVVGKVRTKLALVTSRPRPLRVAR